jgi:hypothetical protein
MTFYNIIFGILFLGAIREVVVAFLLPEGERARVIWEAATLALIIFSDTVYTSHLVEEQKLPYRIWMKLIDLVNFLVLGFAFLLLEPSDKNILQLPVQDILKVLFGPPGQPPRWVFWATIFVYWLLLTAWVRIGTLHPTHLEYQSMTRGTFYSKIWLHNILWFLVGWGRLLGLLFLAFTVAIAAWLPGWLTFITPIVFALALLNLLITGILFNLYERSPERQLPGSGARGVG